MINRVTCLIVLACFTQHCFGQSLNIPSFKTYYGANPEQHQIGLHKQYSNGFGVSGFATMKSTDASNVPDQFFVGPSYTIEDYSNSNWSVSIAPGIWTTGFIYNFPNYPINFGVNSEVNYKISSNYSIRLGVTYSENENFNSSTLGLTYHIGDKFLDRDKGSIPQSLRLSVTYGLNPQGHIFLLQGTLGNNLGFQAITLSDVLHPSNSMLDRYYLGPALTIPNQKGLPVRLNMSLGIYTNGLLNNFPSYPIRSASHLNIAIPWKEKLDICCGIISLPLENTHYNYAGLTYTI